MMSLIDPIGMKFDGMSQGVRSGDWLTISGQVALDQGSVIGLEDPYLQAQQCFLNLAQILAEAKVSKNDLVMLRCYLTTKAAYEGYSQAKKEWLEGHAPASTAVIVQGLLLDDLLMEVEAVAYVPQK